MKNKRGAYLIVAAAAVILTAAVWFAASAAEKNKERSAERESAAEETETGTADETEAETIETEAEAAEAETETMPETESTGTITESESSAAALTEPETAEETETAAAVSGPEVPEGTVKQMIRQALAYVQAGYGYSLEDRCGAAGNFDCSGFVASLLYTEFGCPDYYLNGNPYTTGDWRNMAANYQIGDLIQFGSVTYRVSMKDTEDYLAAFSVPGSIVVQYSPTNRPDKTMGHISVSLGIIPYETTADVIDYIYGEYGILLNGTTVTGYPMVYDQYGAGAGHTAFKVNAQSVANCVIVDNNFASDPSWIEPICIVFEPVLE